MDNTVRDCLTKISAQLVLSFPDRPAADDYSRPVRSCCDAFNEATLTMCVIFANIADILQCPAIIKRLEFGSPKCSHKHWSRRSASLDIEGQPVSFCWKGSAADINDSANSAGRLFFAYNSSQGTNSRSTTAKVVQTKTQISSPLRPDPPHAMTGLAIIN